MKKIFLMFGLSLGVYAIISAQPNKVQSAFIFLKNGQLDKAAENIEPATEHPKTAIDPKTWLYKGNIYLAIAISEEEKYKSLDPNPLQKAYDAYQKSIEIDKDYIQPTANPQSAMLGLFIAGEIYYNTGAEYFNNKQFENAIEQFEKTRKINSIFGKRDTLATYYAAISAIQINEYDKAIQYLRELISFNYMEPTVYVYLSTLYREKKELDKAMQTIKIGKSKFPDDISILIEEINIYLIKNDFENAQKVLEIAIEKDPGNHLLYFTIGSNYDQLKSKEGIDNQLYLEFFKKAEEAYKKTIELNPHFMDAYYNLGALYFNEGLRIFDEAQGIEDLQTYLREEEKFKVFWGSAIIYLEKYHEANPKDIDAMIHLRILYARLSISDKLININQKLEEYQK